MERGVTHFHPARGSWVLIIVQKYWSLTWDSWWKYQAKYSRLERLVLKGLNRHGSLFNFTCGSFPRLLIGLYALDFQIKHLLLTVCICCCSTLKITALKTSITACPYHMKFQLWIRSRFGIPRPWLFHHGECILISSPRLSAELTICTRAAEQNIENPYHAN